MVRIYLVSSVALGGKILMFYEINLRTYFIFFNFLKVKFWQYTPLTWKTIRRIWMNVPLKSGNPSNGHEMSQSN